MQNIPPLQWPASQRCVSTLGCPELDLAKAGQLCMDHDVPMLEIRALEDRLDLPQYLREQYASPETLRSQLLEQLVKIRVFDSSFSLVNAKEEKRDELLELVEWAEVLGVPYIRVFDGGEFAADISAQTIAEAAATVSWWQKLRAREGFQTDIIIETHDSLCSAENCLQLQGALDEPVGLLWDTWHTWFKNREPVADTWNALKNYVRHIHFKDGVREPNENFPYTYKVPGHGVFPLEELFTLLREDSYTGAICLEWERKWHPYLPPLEDAQGADSALHARSQ